MCIYIYISIFSCRSTRSELIHDYETPHEAKFKDVGIDADSQKGTDDDLKRGDDHDVLTSKCHRDGDGE